MKTFSEANKIAYTLVKKSKHKRVAARGISKKDYYIGLGVLALFLLLIYGSTIQTNTASVIGGKGFSTSTTTSGGGLCAAALPVQGTIIDALTGSVVNAPTLNIYQGILNPASPTVSSGGVFTTGGGYNTGTTLLLKISGASTVTEYLPFIVPPITCGSNQSNNVVNIYTITLGSWTITAAGQGGTTFTSGNQYFLSQLPAGAGGTNTITITFSESNNNQGYHSTVDILNNLVQNFVVQIKDTATGLSLSGLPRSQTVGTTRYWLINCADGISGQGYGSGTSGVFAVGTSGDSAGAATTNPATGASLQYPSTGPDSICQGVLSQQKIGNAVTGGTAYFSFGVSKGSLASGSSETLSITGNDYSSISFFQSQTSLGPNTAAVGAPQGSSQGTAFSLELENA